MATMVPQEEVDLISHLPAFYQSILLAIYPYAGLPIDQINMLMILIVQAIAGSIYRRIRGTFIRRLLGMLLGVAILYSMFGVRGSVGLVVYVAAMYYPIVRIKSARLSFWLSMTVLFLSFLYIAWFYYLSWRLDFTTSLMGISIRMHSMTWDLIDYDKIKKGENLGKFKKFNEFRKDHACDSNSISFFDYMAYMLFFVHILCGSNLQINEFLYISDRSIYARNGWRDKEHDPNSKLSTKLYSIAQVLGTAAVFLFGKMFFNFDRLFDPEFQQNTPFWSMLYIVPLSSWFNKFKYHFGWKMLDLSLLTSGAGFSGVDYEADGKTVRKIEWGRANNIWSIKTAFPQNTADVVRHWNMTVNNWLTYYIFFRIESVPPLLKMLGGGEKGGKVLITRIASALFHGVYPCYYLFFFGSAVLTNVIDLLRLILPTFEDEVNVHKRSPYALKSMALYAFWVVNVVATVDSVGICFMQLDLTKTYALYRAIYWFPIWWGVVLMVIGQLLLRTVGVKQIEKDKRAAKKGRESKKEQ